MSKLFTILVLYSLVAQHHISNPVRADGETEQGPEAVLKWFEDLPTAADEKLTKIHFYFHDIVSGINPSAITIVQITNSTRNNDFGMIRMMDNALTVGPGPDSKVIGRAQGIYCSASLGEIDLLMTLNYAFTEGKYNGSTLSILGHNPILHKYREMSIVGGTGVFRMARGVAIARTVWYNVTTGDAVVEYNVIVLHYK